MSAAMSGLPENGRRADIRILSRHCSPRDLLPSRNGIYGISNWSSRDQYTFAPENLITLAHFSVYAAMNVPKSAGELANTA
jgi:hypothetical protein